MENKELFKMCIKTLVLLSLLYNSGDIDEETYLNHLKLKVKLVNDCFNGEIVLD